MRLQLKEIQRSLERMLYRHRRFLFTSIHLYDFTNIEQLKGTPPKTFQELLDESPLMKFGRAPGKCVIGKVVDVCNDDLYVDFGGKFEAVVKRPDLSNINVEDYKKGSLVRLILNKFEMTGAFLGDDRHITLCEADAVLLGPYEQARENTSENNEN